MSMRSCNCGSGSSGGIPRVVAGEGIDISGSGTASDPLVISAETTSFAASFQVIDTPTVDLSLSGSGTASDAFRLSAVATIGMSQLIDVDDPAGPAVNEIPVFNGSKWEFSQPPTVPPGQVNASGGIVGDGTLATPLKINVASTTDTATTGLASYIDTAGALRVVAPPAPVVTWDSITGKPAQYPDAAKVGGRTIYDGTAVPNNSLGVDGDLYVKYQ